jgi:putative transcriptional regulator
MESTLQTSAANSLKNHFLVAMPSLNDGTFTGSVVYICEHNSDGAMGLIINQQLDIPVSAIFDQLQIHYQSVHGDFLIFDGGPVQRDSGFILHRTCSKKWKSTVSIGDDISLTTSKDVLSDIALGVGPKQRLVTLGYSSWGAGQLEQELKENSWLTTPANSAIIFDTDCATRAKAAASSIGLDLNTLALDSGHA